MSACASDIHHSWTKENINNSRHQSHPMIREYGYSHFDENMQASLLYLILAAFSMAPEVVNTRGVKDPFSTSLTHSSYAHLSMFSWSRKQASIERIRYLG